MSTKDRSSQGSPGTAGSASANEADDPSGEAEAGDAEAGDAEAGEAEAGDAEVGDAEAGDAGSGGAGSGDAGSGDAGSGDAGQAGARPNGVFPLKVRAAWDETPTLRGLRLHGPSELLQQYHTPGQYLELVHDEAGSGYFAIAAAPPAGANSTAQDHRELELLVRRGPGLAGVLAGLQPEEGDGAALFATAGAAGSASAAGATSSTGAANITNAAGAANATGAVGSTSATGPAGSANAAGAAGPASAAGATVVESAQALRTQGVRGAGFALTAQKGRDLLLVAAGSGIAPLRAVLQLLLRQRQRFGQVALYYGERTEADFAYRRELEALRAAGVAVELVLSRPPAGWRGGVGYVQDQLRAQPPPWLGAGTVALLCGQSGMISEVTALLTAQKVPPSQILMNY